MSKLIGYEEEQRRERITFSIEQKVQQLCPNSKETLDKHFIYIFFCEISQFGAKMVANYSIWDALMYDGCHGSVRMDFFASCGSRWKPQGWTKFCQKFEFQNLPPWYFWIWWFWFAKSLKYNIYAMFKETLTCRPLSRLGFLQI